MVNVAALQEMALNSVPRSELARRYVNLLKSSDLMSYGYSVSHWIIPGARGSEVLEFNPYRKPVELAAPLPRVTASSAEEQRRIHRALAIPWTVPADEALQPIPRRSRRNSLADF